MLDTDRFLQDLDHLRTIGTYKTGVHRPTFGAEDMQSRHWLCDRMAEIGLVPTLDGIGNIIGRHPGPGPHLLVGSHIESQNYAGWLDGALGVVAGLALARAGLPVDVGVYADEEGHWGDMIGSRSLVGDLSEAQIDQCRNLDGTPLREALATAGLAGVPRLTLETDRYQAALEIHIEQGTQLEAARQSVGIVTSIVGIRHARITIEGQQDHTGGTTMGERRDAGLTAVRLLAAIDNAFPGVCDARTVWTTGRLTLEPNRPMIIPGRAEIEFSFRDISDAVLDRLETCLARVVIESNRRERCPASLVFVNRLKPTPCDDTVRGALEQAAARICPDGWQAMPSGAIHDSQILARRLPVGMVFVPSIGGISHHWTEDTAREDLVAGVTVLAAGAERLLAV